MPLMHASWLDAARRALFNHLSTSELKSTHHGRARREVPPQVVICSYPHEQEASRGQQHGRGAWMQHGVWDADGVSARNSTSVAQNARAECTR